MSLRLFVLLAGLAFVLPLTAQPVTDAAAARPLMAGSAVPAATLSTLEGEPITIGKALDGRPSLVVFYRGSWCPYCNTQLSELRKLLPELGEMGFQMVAISPDRPEELRRTLDKLELDYQLLSDASAELITALGIAFQVDEATRAKHREYNIDLAQASGHDHFLLPVPTVMVVNAAGTIEFIYSNADYRTRVPERLIRAALQASQAGEFGKSVR
ncbi:MAG: AhpC/TSA family protein [Xanthomonadales bacterium]|nr:AhpC/TSA family protein [Xanthomonadales bacterium]